MAPRANNNDREMPLSEHLRELRNRLFVCMAVLLAAALAGLAGNLLFRVLKDAGLEPVPSGLATLVFALVLYLAALQAQGVRVRAVLRPDW